MSKPANNLGTNILNTSRSVTRRFTNALKSPYDKKIIVISAVAVFASIGVLITLSTNARQIINEESVQLSNGKIIRLNQPLSEFRSSLGPSLYRLNDRQYIYRQRPNGPIEAVIDLDASQKAVVIHIVSQPSNIVPLTGARVGISLDTYRQRIQNTAQLSGEIALKRREGFVISQSRSSQYFFSDPCQSARKTDHIALVVKGHESRLLKDLGDSGCVDKD